MPGDELNLMVQIFLPVVIQASAFVVVVVVAVAIKDGFDNMLAKLKDA